MISRFSKLLAIPVLIAGIGIQPSTIMAENPGHTYSAVHATSTTFKEFVVFEEHASVPSVTMSFSIEAGTAIPYTANTMAVYAGLNPELITINPVSFSNADTSSGVAVTETVCPKYDDLDGQSALENLETKLLRHNYNNKYVEKTVTVNMANVTFSEPGIYRYIIHQSINNNFLYPDINVGTNTRYLDVYVTDDENGHLAVSSYVFRETAETVTAGTDKGSADVAEAGDPVDDKSNGFTNWHATAPVEFKEITTGNQGSKDKYFHFVVTYDDLQPEYTYGIDIGNAQATTIANPATIEANTNKQNVAEITTDANGHKVQDFYLKNSQSIRFQLPVGTFNDYKFDPIPLTIYCQKEDYKLEISDYTNESGCSSVEGDTLNTVVYDTNAAGRIRLRGRFSPYANDQITFTLTRDGIIPTGIAVSAAGAIAIVALAIGSLILKRKKKED